MTGQSETHTPGGMRHAVADAINRARYRSMGPGLPECGVDDEDPHSQEYAYRLADAAIAAVLTWNCHDELVAALRAAQEADEALDNRTGYGEWEALDAKARELRAAALAKATSPTP